jgi:hypothetical protein
MNRNAMMRDCNYPKAGGGQRGRTETHQPPQPAAAMTRGLRPIDPHLIEKR